MTRLTRHVQDEQGVEKRPSPRFPAPERRRPRTAGTDRDHDRTSRAANPAHGHPREERLSTLGRPEPAVPPPRGGPRGVRGGHRGMGPRTAAAKGGTERGGKRARFPKRRSGRRRGA